MEKINFINGQTPLNDTNLNQLQTNIENAIPTEEDIKAIILATKPTNIIAISLSSSMDCNVLESYTKVTGFEEVFKIGDKLSFSNNEIVIGKGVSKVLINAKFTWYAETEGLKYIKVLKNNSQVIWSTIDVQRHCFTSDVVSNFPIEVAEGDKISMVYYTNTSGDELGDQGRTYLSVEAILD